MTIAVFGSINIDLTAYVDTLPRPGATVHADRHAIALGGKGANQAVAAQRLYPGAVRFAAALGRDGFGDMARDLLARHGVSDAGLVEDAARGTGLALIHVDARAENAITVIGGANMGWTDDGPDRAVFDGAKVALFQLETPLGATESAMRAARAAGAVVVLDPAPAPARDISALVALADIVTPNETEAQALTGINVPDAEAALSAARALVAMGAGTAIVKRGGDGLVHATADSHGTLPAFRVRPVDTVAAGDCFNGALAAALAEGQGLEDALRFASAAGALATTRPGAADAAPDRPAVEALLARGSSD